MNRNLWERWTFEFCWWKIYSAGSSIGGEKSAENGRYGWVCWSGTLSRLLSSLGSLRQSGNDKRLLNGDCFREGLVKISTANPPQNIYSKSVTNYLQQTPPQNIYNKPTTKYLQQILHKISAANPSQNIYNKPATNIKYLQQIRHKLSTTNYLQQTRHNIYSKSSTKYLQQIRHILITNTLSYRKIRFSLGSWWLDRKQSGRGGGWG